VASCEPCGHANRDGARLCEACGARLAGDAPLLAGDLLQQHVERFNRAVTEGDFARMLHAFAQDAEMVFEGVAVGPFRGRDAIAAAYSAQPPDDTIRLLGSIAVHDEEAASDYAWSRDGNRAGRIVLTARDGAITRLLITFEPS
jgi:steroid Delta-isomerase